MSGKTRKLNETHTRFSRVMRGRICKLTLCFGLVTLPVVFSAQDAFGSERLERKKKESKFLRQMLGHLFSIEDGLPHIERRSMQEGNFKKLRELLLVTTEKVSRDKQKELQLLLDEAILVKDLQKQRSVFREFRHELLNAFEVDSAPALPPDQRKAEQIFKQDCISCHGKGGAGDGILSQKLPRKPRSWARGSHLQSKVPLMILNALIEGRPGTPMASFEAVYSHQELWSLSFYVPCLNFIERLDQRQKEWTDLPESKKKVFLSRGLTYSFLARRSDEEIKRWIEHIPLSELKDANHNTNDWLEILRGGAAFSKHIPRK